VRKTLDGPAIRQFAQSAAAALTEHRAHLDAANVFPVADRDTGTNAALTVQAGADALAGVGSPTAAEALRVLAGGAARAARGNSGLLLSQVLRGLAERTVDEFTADSVRAGLRRGAELAYAAVSKPVEGTVLTVARAAADAANRVGASLGGAHLGGDANVDGGAGLGGGTEHPGALAAVLRAAVGAAAAAVRATPQQLPILARAGVVDAGGEALLVMLNSLAEVVGLPSCLSAAKDSPGDVGTAKASFGSAGGAASDARSGATSDGGADAGGDEAGSNSSAWPEGDPALGYEVQYLLRAEAPAVAALRDELDAVGDSLAVIEVDEALWSVHVHTPAGEVGAAIDAGVAAGAPERITVVRLSDPTADPTEPIAAPTDPAADPTDHAHPAAEPTGQSVAGRPHESTAVVVVGAGEGLAHLFAAEGAQVVDGQPSVSELGAVIGSARASGAAHVALLPVGEAALPPARAAADQARAAGVDVAVVPARSPLQALAAVAVHDRGRWVGDDVIAMANAAAATRCAQVVLAERDALTSVGPCRSGDALGFIDGDVVQIGAGVRAVALAVVDRLLGTGGELITIVTGRETSPDDVAALRARIADTAPLVEVSVLAGGQGGCPLLIGLE